MADKNIIYNQELNRLQTPASVAIADKVRMLATQGVKVAKMQTGEPCFNTPEYIVEGAYKAMRDGFTHYDSSQGLPALRKQISLWYEEEYLAKLSADDIVITNGAIHGIFCVLAALLNRGDEVIVPKPCWPQYNYISLLFGADVKNIDTIRNGGRLSPSDLEKNISGRTKVFILNNPCNPTGVVYSKEELNEFLRICLKNNVFLLADEVYSRVIYTNKFCSIFMTDEYCNAKDRIIYINSFSKTFAMTGWRVGYCVLPYSVGQKVLKVSQNSITNVSTFSQHAAKVAIEHKDKNRAVFSEMNSLYRSRYAELLRMLKEKKIEFIFPEGAFYFFIKNNASSGAFAEQLLETERIAVVPGAAYGQACQDYYRISFAVDEYSFSKFTGWLNAS